MKFLVICLLLIVYSSAAQNYIPNGDFESRDSCPTGLRQINFASNWYSASSGTPEYFNTCGFPGTIAPFKGNGMIGIIAYSSYKSDLEYVSVKLSRPLQEGKSYRLSFYLRAKEDAPFLINRIGAYLTEDAIRLAHWKVIEGKPQVFAKNIIPASRWTKVEGVFTASGTEQYITLGSFFPKEQVKTEYLNGVKSHGWYSYYYIDEIQLEPFVDDKKALPSSSQSSSSILNNLTVYFDTDEFHLSLEEEKKVLDFIFQLENLNVKAIHISGHTDADASEEYNAQLSILRCNEVARIIGQLTSIKTILDWSGEISPAVPNDIEKNKALNRRVELNAILK